MAHGRSFMYTSHLRGRHRTSTHESRFLAQLRFSLAQSDASVSDHTILFICHPFSRLLVGSACRTGYPVKWSCANHRNDQLESGRPAGSLSTLAGWCDLLAGL